MSEPQSNAEPTIQGSTWLPLTGGALVAVWQLTGNEGDSEAARAFLGIGGFTGGLVWTLRLFFKSLHAPR